MILKLAYLCDIYEKLNIPIKSLLGKVSLVLQLTDKIAVFQNNLLLWKRKIAEEHRNTDCFLVLKGSLKPIDINPINFDIKHPF